VARRCAVCGFESEGAVCPRCNTILLRGQAICTKCGKLFPGWIAVCDACGAPLPPEPKGPEDEEAVQLLASVPGISQDRARALVARGFRDFSDIVRLALPEGDVQRGLHHAIARRALLADLAPKAARPASRDRCPVCDSAWRAGADHCTTCGSAMRTDMPVEMVGQKLQEVTEQLVGLSDDQDFREMPEDIRRELIGAFGGLSPEEVVREEYRRQIDAWRKKGFDVETLETLLATDLDGFRERSVRLIRAQILKKAEKGQFRCPLCDVRLPPAAEQCENCGAKFV
jgi:predicted amidophosphoribosyltransferase